MTRDNFGHAPVVYCGSPPWSCAVGVPLGRRAVGVFSMLRLLQAVNAAHAPEVLLVVGVV